MVVNVSEGANMPSTNEAVDFFVAQKIAYGPGKQQMLVGLLQVN